MRSIDIRHWNHKGFDIYEAIHPKLIGKYEVYKDETFIDRALTIADAKRIIDEYDQDNEVQRLYDRMFTKYYNGNQLADWMKFSLSGGGNADNYKRQIRKLLDEDFRVKTGYMPTRIRGVRNYYIFYKWKKPNQVND